MKVAFGHKPVDGPWGGGNRFATALIEALQARGDQVVFNLDHHDIDIILVVDPRSRNPSVPFTPSAVFRHLKRHPDSLVVHRINECDERKGTRGMNALLKLANYVADHTVFIASWLAELDLWRHESDHSIILNGADERLFRLQAHRPWNGVEPFRLVTHHWGAHAMKGFDVYKHIDYLLAQDKWRERLSFTYIGNLPDGVRFSRARCMPPLNGRELADELGRHHAYVSASLNEPAGMHHIEGALCGLPLLFRNSGALPEYCEGFGEIFEGTGDVEAMLERLLGDYAKHQAALAVYPHTAEKMCRGYLDLFDRLVADRQDIVKSRRLGRDWLAAARIQLRI